MYAMSGKFTARAGRSKELADILLRAANLVSQLPGCHSYIVNEELANENILWVFEVWDDKEKHDSSLRDERVSALITLAMPLLDGAPVGISLRVAGGYGIK